MKLRGTVPKQRTREGVQLQGDIDRGHDFDRGVHDAGRTPTKDMAGSEEIVFSAAGQQTLYHGLRRQPQGWRLMDKTATADIWRVSWDSETIILESSAAVTIRVEVF